jgi:hypothetical protein
MSRPRLSREGRKVAQDFLDMAKVAGLCGSPVYADAIRVKASKIGVLGQLEVGWSA